MNESLFIHWDIRHYLIRLFRVSWDRHTSKIPELFLLSLCEMYSSLWDCPNKGADLV